MSNSFIAKRLKGLGSPIHKVLPAVVELLSGWQSLPPLNYVGYPARIIELTEASLEDYINSLDEIRDTSTSKSLILSSSDREPKFTLIVHRHSLAIQGNQWIETEGLEFVIPSEIMHNSYRLRFFPDVIAQLCSIFSAYHGYVYDEMLLQLHGRSIRMFEKSLATTPPHLQKFIPNPLPIEGVTDTLPPLLLENEFDNRRVPNGVWWINYWDDVQVETVGVDRIKNAPWSRALELPEKSMVLVVTEEQTNIKNQIHMNKLHRIVEHLHLRSLQEKYVVSQS